MSLESRNELFDSATRALVMNPTARRHLQELVSHTRIAALATLHNGFPVPSMVPVVPCLSLLAPGFYFRASTLAHHTQDFLKDSRAGLLLCETDSPGMNTQNLARLSLQGEIHSVKSGSIPESCFQEAEGLYLARFPEARITLALADFAIYAFVPQKGRYIAGPGQAFDLSASHLFELLGAG